MVSDTAGDKPGWQRAFLEHHRLDEQYLEAAATWFEPLATRIAMHQKGAAGPLLVGVNGSQGSGKTTLCDYLVQSLTHNHALRAHAMSLDDFYLTRAERQHLAEQVHPLFATRGVPGTHDHALLDETLNALLGGAGDANVAVPTFEKLRDDRAPRERWLHVDLPVDVVLLEGWCLGAIAVTADSLQDPVNDLEATEDEALRWRTAVNTALHHQFPPLYRKIGLWVMLRAPSFECVYDWRREQEDKLSAAEQGADQPQPMDTPTLHRFISHFERLTRQCLQDLPGKVHHLLTLDASRQVQAHRHNENPQPLW